MIRFVSWLVSLGLLVAGVVFAVTNRTLVTISLEPLYFITDLPLCGEGAVCGLEAPIYLVVLASIALGFLWGGLSAYSSGSGARRQARTMAYEASKATREAVRLREQVTKLEAEKAAAHMATPDELPAPTSDDA